jgi:RNA polymerase sigma factor (sigma-70 family)
VIAMQDLIKQYNKSLYRVKKLREVALPENGDQDLLDSMASDLRYSIEWMKTGRRPGNKRGIERRAAYQRERPVDPIILQNYAKKTSGGTYYTLTDSERERLADALSILTDREQEIYILARGECFTYEQIASMLCVSKSTIQDTIERAEKKIMKRTSESLFCFI